MNFLLHWAKHELSYRFIIYYTKVSSSHVKIDSVCPGDDLPTSSSSETDGWNVLDKPNLFRRTKLMSQTSNFSWTWLDKFGLVSWKVRRLAHINLGVLNGGDFSHRSLKQRFILLPCGNIPPPVIFSHVSSVGIYPSVVVSTNLSFHSCNYSTVLLLYPFDNTVCN